ncbi:MAG: S1 RNA-binding domain-containing protein [Oscillospiraceae bacterium]
MQVEVGAIFEGKVTGITKFGAFVDFAEGKTGMVHISEVAPTFVKEIRDFVTEGQIVKVKVLSVSEEGKISLSMKKAEPQAEHPPQQRFQRNDRPQKNNNFRHPSPPPSVAPARPGDFEWQSKPLGGGNFEDMMSRFKQTSDEKISDLKKSTETKRGSFPSRRDNQNK